MRHGARPRNRLVRYAAVAALIAAPLVTLSSLGQADPLAPPLGRCVGDCPNPFPQPPHSGPAAGTDDTINIFVGGNYTVEGRAAEAEGKIVTVKDLTVNKDGGGLFNMGVVGVGSQVAPPPGTDHVTVGGAVDVLTGNRVQLGGGDPARWGNLAYGTTESGILEFSGPGAARQDPAAIEPFLGLTTVIESDSTCMAEQTATGELTVDGNLYTFTGDGLSMRQIFNVDRNIGSDTAAADIVFANVPPGATVIVNMIGPDPVLIRTNTGTGFPGDQLTDMQPLLMWNFPTSADATISGGAQFQGSVMAGNPAGTVTLSNPGTNGRVYLAGNLLQTGTAGTEIHAYPFDGDLPTCRQSPSPSPSESESPSPSPSVSPSESESPSPSPSETESPEPSESVEPTHGERPEPSHRPGGGLANTGSSLVAPVAGAAVVLLGLGGGAVVLARRNRSRRH
ncbi:choice-of-anchor A family protein [Kitasatospora sp. NPDC092948]|uniref:choice-of-anchor A family protein n=1 Tax=Kitasatospora sp. NPDC092948 TaxID=3364088 RepID=UPI00382104C4